MIRSLRTAGAVLPVLFACSVALSAPRDMAALYRADTPGAEKAMRWRGPALDDDARLAAVAAGLSWQPVWEGTPLFAREKSGLAYTEAARRRAAFLSAWKAGNERVAVPFALSLALDPPDDPAAWQAAYDYLRDYDEGFDRVLIGVLQAPEKLTPLSTHQYAALDLLVWRASPRLLPLFMTLADASDRYVRSRAIVGLGVVAYRARHGETGLFMPMRENSVSSMQQRMIAELVRRAAEDKNYHVRAAAAVAIGLSGDEEDVPTLQKLARDPAYLLSPGADRDARRVVFPVRVEAARSLRLFGRDTSEVAEGAFSGKALKQVLRGGKDVTHDHSDMRKNAVSRVRFGRGEW